MEQNNLSYDSALAILHDNLSHAGQDRQLLECLQRAETLRITHTTVIPKQQFLFRMYGRPCFPRGELVAVAGKAKSGKTFISSALMSLCFRDNVLGISRMPDACRDNRKLKVLWFDTEQSAESTQSIFLKRIVPMICAGREMLPNEITAWQNTSYDSPSVSAAMDEIEQRFEIYNTRSLFWQDRLQMFEVLVKRALPDLVVLDGVRDLIDDINNGTHSQELIERLMHLASEINCCIICVLHQNKAAEDNNLRGFLGTELKNKVFEAYECSKDENRIFTFHQTDTRKYDIIDKLQYTVDKYGIPRLANVSLSPVIPMKPAIARLDRNTVMNAFRTAFRPNEKTKSYKALMATVMRVLQLSSKAEYRLWLIDALNSGVVHEVQKDLFIPADPPEKPLGGL